MKTFGVGCLYFGIEKDEYSVGVTEYIDDVKKLLDKIPSVSSVSIQADSVSPDIQVHQPDEALEPGANLRLTQAFRGVHIDLTLVIPKKAHNNYGPDKLYSYMLRSERYRIDIRYTYFGAMCFVLPEHEEDFPSQAVILVREFLQSEIRKISTPYRFVCLGPSPLHADFYFESDGKGSTKIIDDFLISEVAADGYNDFNILYNGKKFSDDHQALSRFCDIVEDEFGYFYLAKSKRAEKIFAWYRVAETVESLLDIEKETGFKGILRRLFVRGWLSRRLFTDLAVYKAEGIYIDGGLKDAFRDLYKPGLKKYFEKLCSGLQDEMPVVPEKEVAELAAFVHETSSQVWDKAAVVIAGLLGGVVGAVVTVSLSK